MNKYCDLKIFAHPEKVASFREGRITAPLYVRIKPYNICNDHCWWCVYHAPEHSGMHTEMKERDVIGLPKLLEILEDLKAIGVKAVTYSGGGEPLMHKDAAEFLRRTLELGLDLSVITNGQFLKGERAVLLAQGKWVRVSIDYADGEQLLAMRKTPAKCFEERMENLAEFARLKRSIVQSARTAGMCQSAEGCDLEVNFIVHRDNYKRLYEMAERLKGLGVENVRFSPMWVAPGFREEIKMVIQEKKQGDGTLVVGMEATAEGRASSSRERDVANRVLEAAVQAGEAMAKENLGGYSTRHRGNLG